MSYYILYLVRLVFFSCLLLPGWISKLQDGICSAWMGPGVPSTERCFFSSPAREPSISICPHTTQASAFHPTLLTQRQKPPSLVLMLLCTLQAHLSLLLSLQVSVIVCVKEPHHHLHPYYIRHDQKPAHTHAQWVVTCLHICAAKFKITTQKRKFLNLQYFIKEKKCQNLFKRSFSSFFSLFFWSC